MKIHLTSVAAAGLVAVALPAFAQTATTTTVTTTKPSAGAAVGVAGGAATGAVVGGPVGAVVGAVVGGVAGAIADPPAEVKTYVREQNVAPITYDGQIVVGKPLPDAVAVYDVPNYDRYSWTYVNGQRILIDHKDRKVIAVIN